MSADEDSFVVLEETPSMLEFSVLESLSSATERVSASWNRTEKNSEMINSSLERENDNIKILQISDEKPKLGASNIFANLHIGENSSNIQNISPNDTTVEILSGTYNGESTSPKSTLAHSFLLGDINCDKMKV